MRWHIVECARGYEAKACTAVMAYCDGHEESWYPTRKVEIKRKYRLLPTGTRPRKRYKTYAEVPGYVFVLANSLSLYGVNTHEALWLRVLAPGGKVYTVTDEDMAAMQQVPERVRELVDEARRREYEAWQARMPKIGTAAKITSGPLTNMSGIVKDISDGAVRIELPIIGRATVPETFCERVA